jgi:hypothetical protein
MKIAATTLALMLTMAAHAGARPANASRNACEVLTRTDLAKVQGEAWSDARLSSRGATSQCFYQLPSFVNSVSLDLTRGDARQIWRERFEAEEEEEGKEGKKKHPPTPVQGIGDEAFWVGNHMTGSLYVLKGDAVLRVSIGGKGTEQEKITTSKTLVRRALKRL